MLRQTVVSIYVADELRRVITESLLPYLTQNSQKLVKKLSLARKIEKTGEDDKQRLINLEELEELQKDEHEIFDDYLEMIVTFGYITMFASVFCLGATCIFIFILIESRSDIFRLEKTLKRPIPGKTYHIGSWAIIIEIFCFLGIFSNIIICCYTSNQIDAILPWMKDLKEDSITAVTTIFGLEHILLFVTMLIRIMLDKDPHWVTLYLARRAYRLDKLP